MFPQLFCSSSYKLYFHKHFHEMALSNYVGTNIFVIALCNYFVIAPLDGVSS